MFSMKEWLFLVVFLIIVAVGCLTLFQKEAPIVPLSAIPTPAPTSSSDRLDMKGETNGTDLQIRSGFSISFFAKSVQGARDLQFAPDGALLVSSTSQGKVFRISDTDNDGVADSVTTMLSGLTHPHGLAFYQGKLYVAEETRVSRYIYDQGKAALEKKILDLPAGGRHFTRGLVFDNNGKLYISLGSTCDTCIEKNPWLASVVLTDSSGSNPQVYASGLRNAVFMALDPQTNAIWVTEMGRDYLGDVTPPDEINILKQGNYGWPYCYGYQIKDTQSKIAGAASIDCYQTIPPVFQIDAHSAPLGLAFVESSLFPKSWENDLIVAYHGSTNSKTVAGYSVVRMVRSGDKIVKEEPFISGFYSGKSAVARPVDVAFDSQGAMYISDDKAGNIYRIVKQ